MKRTILTVALGIAVAAVANRQPAAAVTSSCGSSTINDSADDAFDRDTGLDRGGYRAGDSPDDADDLSDDSRVNPNLDRTRPDIDDDNELRPAPDQVPGARAPIP
jgi:hypothetical protein